MSKQITMPLHDYEQMKRKITELKAEMDECINNGKAKVRVVTKYIMRAGEDHFYMHAFHCYSSTEQLLTDKEIYEIQNTELKNAITACYAKASEVDSTIAELKKIKHELETKTFFQRLKYLFNGDINSE